MSSGLRDNWSFHRRQRRKRMAKWLFLLASLIALGAFAYWTGAALAEREVVQLREEIVRLTKTVDDLRHDNFGLHSTAEAARRAEAEWRQRYQKEVPTGTRKDLLAQVENQMAAGVKADRLRFLISAAAGGEACSGSPETKRFMVKTPIAPSMDGSVASVGFADGTITVTAEGEPALTPDGKPQAWYDPGGKMTVRFTHLGGKGSEVSGTLPLHHSVVVKNNEYRFTVFAGERRGFVHVTGDRCSFP